ncbi:conserved Plasmodium protein, unknown function [Plasmodium malariae]|uniref:Uncharacterized protein n=1 Tax=Plasmodium malariae TaxID=5858 RepID=A0A1C3KEL6_PLAMA|nr:conserved Plasmodium protein, unknown function [Plasmodium malariae]
MRLYTLTCIYIVVVFVSTLSVKIQRSIHYINNKILKNTRINNKAPKNFVHINNHKEQTYLQKVQSNIAQAGETLGEKLGKKFGKGINNPISIAAIIFAISSVIGFFYKRGEKEIGEKTNDSYKTNNELSKYRCVKCNLVMFPAKGREQKFLKENFICPNCGQSNMDKHVAKK